MEEELSSTNNLEKLELNNNSTENKRIKQDVKNGNLDFEVDFEIDFPEIPPEASLNQLQINNEICMEIDEEYIENRDNDINQNNLKNLNPKLSDFQDINEIISKQNIN